MVDDSLYKSQEEKILLEADQGSFDRSRQKSSRSKADFFELLLAVELNRYYKLPYQDLEIEIKKLISKIMDFKDGSVRIEEQKDRVKFLLPFLVKELDKLIIINGKPIEVRWVGRKWQTNKTLSDINIKFLSGKNIGISTKSTRSGKGTQKNIGLKELKGYLGLNIDKELTNMKNKIISKVAIRNKELKAIAKKGMTFIKNNKYKFPIIQKIGKEFGIPLQQLAVKQSVKLFNQLTPNKKKAFINFILGVRKEEFLLNAFASGKQIHIYWNISLSVLVGDNLKAVNEGDRGYHIASNNKKIIRIQVNFTNGIGISAFCERAFL